MEEKIRKYVEGLFADAPKTKLSIELRQEIYSNLMDKYGDLRTSGATEEEAFEIVKRSVGNVDELISGLYEKSKEDKEIDSVNQRRAAKYNAIAVALYILSPVFIISFAVAGYWLTGLILLLVCVAVATGIKVYSNSMFTPYQKMDDTLVEEFKEWKAENDDKVKKKNVYSGVLWPIIFAVYFILSFTTGAWYITWVLFIIGAAIEQLIKIQLYK
ncbi:MAG: permease prefix domain 1-containing protein [Christensenellaceae bacterium]|jgi:hypothetical protein